MVRRQPQTTPKPEDDDMINADAATSASDAAKEIFAGMIESTDGIYTDPSGNVLSLVARLARIKEGLPVLNPEGENKHFNYKFVKNTQVLGVLRPRLAVQRIMVIPETVEEREAIPMKTQKGGSSLLTRMTVTWRIIDGVTGESFTGQSVGYGDDTGDKGANKAFTAAQKNFLIRLFEIGGEPDLEEDEETDRRARTRDAGTERVRRVEIGDADIDGIKRGGRSEKATDAQVAAVGNGIRDLGLAASAFATVVDKVLGDQLELGESPWNDIKAYLEGLSGEDIGKLVKRLDAMLDEDDEPKDQAGSGQPDGGYDG